MQQRSPRAVPAYPSPTFQHVTLDSAVGSGGSAYPGPRFADMTVLDGSGSGGIPDAPSDGNIYGRKNAAWVQIPALHGASLLTSMAVGNSASNILPDVLRPNTVDNSLNSRRVCYAPAKSAITDIALAFPGFISGNGGAAEANQAVAYTATASVEYPVGTTPRQVFWNGATSVTVQPGRTMVKSDPYPVYIPAGAAYGVKCFVTWPVGNFYMQGIIALTFPNGEWTVTGTGLTDQTLTLTTFSGTNQTRTFAPLVYGTMATATPIIGMVGDSIGAGLADQPDPSVLGQSWALRGLNRGAPITNPSWGGYSASLYLSRQEGQGLLLRNAITHLIWALGSNDIFGNSTSFATMQQYFLAGADPFLARGVKVHATTITPRSTSTDHWLTTANQTLLSASNEATRQSYNSWLLGNWAALGLSGIIDTGHAIDPNDTGLWGADPGAAVFTTGNYAAGYATLSGGAVASAAPGTVVGGQTVGSGYPNTTQVPWTSYPLLGDPGSGAAGTVTSNSSGQMTTWAVTAGGSGYAVPPLLNIRGPWTLDGIHPTPRGYNEIIYRSKYGAAMFVV